MLYLASPYSHPDPNVREQRFHEACRVSAALLSLGLNVFSPIAHSHPMVQFGLPTNWEFWAQLDRDFLNRCDLLAVLTMPGWQDSRGVAAEMKLAAELHKQVVSISPDLPGHEMNVIREALKWVA